MTDLTMSQKDDLIAAQAVRIAELEAEVHAERRHHGIRNASAVRTLHALGYSWRGTDAWQPPAEQGKCLHQIAEPQPEALREYDVCVIFDASRNVTVMARTPEEAAELAEDEAHGAQHLCNQCSGALDTGDAIGSHVYEGDTEVLDSTAAGELRIELAAAKARIAELEASQAQRAPLTDAECDSLISALCPDFCDERFPGDRPILRQLARDALNPNLGITAIDSRITQEQV